MGSYRSSKEKPHQVKAQWTPENHELFVDLCLEQASIGNKPGSHFTPKGWKNIVDLFQSITDLKYDRIQLKNHWDLTKKNWKIWHKLISSDEMKWDSETRSFGANEQDWNEYLRANPDAAQFQSKELLFADKLDIIFGGGEDTELSVKRTDGKKINCFTGAEPTTRRKKHNSGKSTNTMLTFEEPIDAKPEAQVELCYDAVESRSGVTVQSPPLKFSYTIEECIKCLDSIDVLEQGSELYLFALDIFLKKEYREIFLNLKKSSTRVAWLKRLQSNGAFLPLQ